MQYNIVVGTQHKTGTVWMSSVFSAFADSVGAKYVDFWTSIDDLPTTLSSPYILFNYHSAFRQHTNILSRDDVRILHLIRDPRDVLISAMHFHKKSEEGWLHEASPHFDGMTYQQKLNSLPSSLHQFVFEMENSTKATIAHMDNWRYDRPNSLEIRYEDLIVDHDLKLWTQIMDFLGLDYSEQKICRDHFWNYSLFGGLAGASHSHVRSGGIAQWKKDFTLELAHEFIARFPNILQKLGYEKDNTWVETLSHHQNQAKPLSA